MLSSVDFFFDDRQQGLRPCVGYNGSAPRLRLFDLETCFREGLPDPTQRPFDHGAALTLALDAEDAVKATVMEALETGADVVRVHPVPSCALTDGNAGLEIGRAHV